MLKTIESITRVVGLDIDKIRQLTPEEEDAVVKKVRGVSISYPRKRPLGSIGQGNPLLSRYKFRTLDDLDRKSKDLFGM